MTVQVLTLNDAGTIRRCLESVLSLDAKVLVGDLGSEDGTQDICRNLGAEVLPMKSEGNSSVLRNSLIREGVNMYLEPWEFISAGQEEIGGLSGNSAFYVVRGGTVSKEVRLWNDGSFKNPVFEYLESGSEPAVLPGVVVVSNGAPDRRPKETRRCRAWVDSSPTSPDPYYYLACSLLAEGNVEEFLGVANKYMIMSGGRGDSSILMNYYMARAESSKGAFKHASARVLQCMALRPTFAEFWCLLGDMLYARGRYEKARAVYMNARIIGARRRSDDMFPIEVSKYGAYPREMEMKCSEMGDSGFFVAGKSEDRNGT